MFLEAVLRPKQSLRYQERPLMRIFYEVVKAVVIDVLRKLISCEFSEIYGTMEKSLARYFADEKQ